jgi:hypothetical protein
MPPKPQESKKAVQKKKQSAIDDKTFGLKNKNKSKKVQSYVQSVEKNVLNSGESENCPKGTKESRKGRTGCLIR